MFIFRNDVYATGVKGASPTVDTPILSWYQTHRVSLTVVCFCIVFGMQIRSACQRRPFSLFQTNFDVEELIKSSTTPSNVYCLVTIPGISSFWVIFELISVMILGWVGLCF